VMTLFIGTDLPTKSDELNREECSSRGIIMGNPNLSTALFFAFRNVG
jgi:hypothetical protein